MKATPAHILILRIIGKNYVLKYTNLFRNRLVVEQPAAVQMPSKFERLTKQTFAQRITNLYLRYNPAKLMTKATNDTALKSSFVQTLLDKCAGKEEKLIARLVQQYGPEPSIS